MACGEWRVATWMESIERFVISKEDRTWVSGVYMYVSRGKMSDRTSDDGRAWKYCRYDDVKVQFRRFGGSSRPGDYLRLLPVLPTSSLDVLP